MIGRFSGFDWDAGNREKCRKHGLTESDIEALFDRPIMILADQAHSMSEVRYRAVGTSGTGRHVFLVFTLRSREDRDFIRPISARYMHRKEVAFYEEANPDLPK